MLVAFDQHGDFRLGSDHKRDGRGDLGRVQFSDPACINIRLKVIYDGVEERGQEFMTNLLGLAAMFEVCHGNQARQLRRIDNRVYQEAQNLGSARSGV